MERIVLTGGPGAGKTVITRHLSQAHPERFIHVPEAATQVYEALQTRWDLLDLPGRREVQRQIYRLQRNQEDRLAAEHPGRMLLLDRGTVDGAAYWPEGPDDYWRDVGTTADAELARYSSVVWMQTGAAIGIYDFHHSNTCRFEDREAAVASGLRLAKLWQMHPRLQCVQAYATLTEKIGVVEKLLVEPAATG